MTPKGRLGRINWYYRKAKRVGCKFRNKDVRRLASVMSKNSFAEMLDRYFTKYTITEDRVIERDLVKESLLETRPWADIMGTGDFWYNSPIVIPFK